MLSDLAAEFLRELSARGASPHTVKSYRLALGRLCRALPSDPEAVTARHLEAALVALGGSGSTAAHRRSVLSSFFGWLERAGYTGSNPALHLGPVKRPEGLPRPIPEDDLGRVLGAVRQLPPVPRTLFLLLADTGLRVGEALSLDVCDVVWDPGQEAVLVERGKGGRARVVPLVPDMVCFAPLRKLCRERRAGPLFVSARGTRMDYDTARCWWEKALALAGVEGYTIHQLRHTAVSRWVREGVNLAAVRRLAGHRSMQTTMRYAEVHDEMVRREMRRVWGKRG